MATSPYKRRRSHGVIRNLWVSRRLIAAAFVLGVTLWFILVNNTAVTVFFPFWLGQIETTSGIAILLGMLAGSVVTGLLMTLFLTIRRYRGGREGDGPGPDLPEDRPPTDYAAKTGEGFPDAPWGAR